MKKKVISMRVNSMIDSDSAIAIGDSAMAEVLVDFICASDYHVDDPKIEGLLRVAAELKRRRSAEITADFAEKIFVERLRRE